MLAYFYDRVQPQTPKASKGAVGDRAHTPKPSLDPSAFAVRTLSSYCLLTTNHQPPTTAAPPLLLFAAVLGGDVLVLVVVSEVCAEKVRVRTIVFCDKVKSLGLFGEERRFDGLASRV